MRSALVALGLTALVLACYVRTKDHPFTQLDDPLYVTGCRPVQQGLSLENVRWALGSAADANRIPLTWLSHMAVVEVWGLDPGPHHLVNVALHLANVLALFWLVRRLVGGVWPGAFAAALLAVHPIHVESVAWIAERKDVLSLLAGLSALHAYVSWARRPGPGRYALVAACLALGLAAKGMLVTLPCVMVLLDVWPLGRVGGARDLGRRILEKVPLLALSGVATWLTIRAQDPTGVMMSIDALPFSTRAANAVVGYGRYLRKLAWPLDLCPFYPYRFEIPLWQVGLSAVVLAGITVQAVRLARRAPWLAIGWFWFLGTLFPFAGLTQSGSQSMADRYAYLPAIGLYLAAATSLARLATRAPRLAATAGAAAILWLTAWNVVQVGYWESDERLYRRTLEVTGENSMARKILGDAELERGDLEAAARHFAEAVRIAPDFAPAHLGLARAHLEAGQLEPAEYCLREAIRLDEDLPAAHFLLGLVLQRRGRHAEALAEVERELELDPWRAPAHNARGQLLVSLRRFEEGVAAFERSAALEPDQFEAWFNLGSSRLLFLDDPAGAVGPLERALEVRPDDEAAGKRLARARELASR